MMFKNLKLPNSDQRFDVMVKSDGKLALTKTDAQHESDLFLLPLLGDGHIHMPAVAKQFSSIDLTGCSSFAELVTQLESGIKEYNFIDWVTGRGWSDTNWQDKPKNALKILDKICPMPLSLSSYDGHRVLCNSAALQAATILSNNPNPSGGEFVRDNNGEFTGECLEVAATIIREAIAPLPLTEQVRLYALAEQKMLSLGIGYVHTILQHRWEWELLQHLLQETKLLLDTFAIFEWDLWLQVKDNLQFMQGDEHLRIGHVKCICGWCSFI